MPDTGNVKKSKGCFLVSNGTEHRLIAPAKLTTIAVMTQRVFMSGGAFHLAIEHEIPILFFDDIGRPKGRLWSNYFGSIATVRRQQLKFSEHTAATKWVIDLFLLKLEHQTENLRFLQNRKSAQKEAIESAIVLMNEHALKWQTLSDRNIPEVRDQIMGTEGIIARNYWNALSSCLPENFDFEQRTRRPAEDTFNAALNYAYGILYNVVEGAVLGAGLDPQTGVLHADEFNKPVFAFDLIEPFRPWIDRVLIATCLEGQWQEGYFEPVPEHDKGITLSKAGKAWLIPAVNACLVEKCRFREKQLSRKNHIHTFAGSLAQWLLGQTF